MKKEINAFDYAGHICSGMKKGILLTTKAGGNGIGTMIIERVCREHGAEFGVVSAEERGTVFQLKFPNGRRRMRMLPGN